MSIFDLLGFQKTEEIVINSMFYEVENFKKAKFYDEIDRLIKERCLDRSTTLGIMVSMLICTGDISHYLKNRDELYNSTVEKAKQIFTKESPESIEKNFEKIR